MLKIFNAKTFFFCTIIFYGFKTTLGMNDSGALSTINDSTLLDGTQSTSNLIAQIGDGHRAVLESYQEKLRALKETEQYRAWLQAKQYLDQFADSDTQKLLRDAEELVPVEDRKVEELREQIGRHKQALENLSETPGQSGSFSVDERRDIINSRIKDLEAKLERLGKKSEALTPSQVSSTPSPAPVTAPRPLSARRPVSATTPRPTLTPRSASPKRESVPPAASAADISLADSPELARRPSAVTMSPAATQALRPADGPELARRSSAVTMSPAAPAETTVSPAAPVDRPEPAPVATPRPPAEAPAAPTAVTVAARRRPQTAQPGGRGVIGSFVDRVSDWWNRDKEIRGDLRMRYEDFKKAVKEKMNEMEGNLPVNIRAMVQAYENFCAHWQHYEAAMRDKISDVNVFAGQVFAHMGSSLGKDTKRILSTSGWPEFYNSALSKKPVEDKIAQYYNLWKINTRLKVLLSVSTQDSSANLSKKLLPFRNQVRTSMHLGMENINVIDSRNLLQALKTAVEQDFANRQAILES